MAREGADISIVHLPKEQEDAEYTKSMIEKEGRSGHLIAGDLRDRDFCYQAVKQHVQKFMGPTLLLISLTLELDSAISTF
jgi:hypothetical protein